MDKGQEVALPAASFGEWHAAGGWGGDTDWSNAVWAGISTHYTLNAYRSTIQLLGVQAILLFRPGP